MGSKKLAPLSTEEILTDSGDRIKSVGLVVDLDGMGVVEELLKLKGDLGIKDLDFEIIVCLAPKQKVDNFDGIVFTPAGISWLGRIKNEEVKRFISRPFDLLLTYRREETKTSKLVLTTSKARLKVGRKEEAPQIYELAIATPFEEVEVFMEEVKKYLRILKKIK